MLIELVRQTCRASISWRVAGMSGVHLNLSQSICPDPGYWVWAEQGENHSRRSGLQCHDQPS